MKHTLHTFITTAVIGIMGLIMISHAPYAEAIDVQTVTQVPMCENFSRKLCEGKIGLIFPVAQLKNDDAYADVVFQKTFNFIKENNTHAPLSFTMETGDEIRAEEEATTGWWFLTRRIVIGGSHKPGDDPTILEGTGPGGFFEMNGVGYKVHRGTDRLEYAEFFFSEPEDSGEVSIQSSNPNVVSCTSAGCVANGAGTAQVTVSFESRPQTLPMGRIYSNGDETPDLNFSGDNDMGYGQITIGGSVQFWVRPVRPITRVRTDSVVWTYDFPAVTYTVTVEGQNTPHVVTFQKADQIIQTAARIYWTYDDIDGDVQTNYQVDIATSDTFSPETIIRSFTKPANQNVENIRSVPVTGLEPDTQYYVRVRGYNNVNLWSVYDFGSFRTLPLNGMCAPLPDPENLGQPCGCENTGTIQCDGSCSAELTCPEVKVTPIGVSCSPSPVTGLVGDSVTFNAVSRDAVGPITYQWSLPSSSNNNLPGTSVGGNSSRYSTTFSGGRGGDITRVFVTATDTETGATAQSYCQASVKIEKDRCTSGGCTRPTDPDKDPDTDPTVPTIKIFKLDPRIVPTTDDMCKLELEAENVSRCVLLRGGSQSISPISGDASGIISTKGSIGVPIGTHQLQCTGQGEGASSILYTQQSCILNPAIRED